METERPLDAATDTHPDAVPETPPDVAPSTHLDPAHPDVLAMHLVADSYPPELRAELARLEAARIECGMAALKLSQACKAAEEIGDHLAAQALSEEKRKLDELGGDYETKIRDQIAEYKRHQVIALIKGIGGKMIGVLPGVHSGDKAAAEALPPAIEHR